MTAKGMFDVRCATCGKTYGWGGSIDDCPPCPRCGQNPSEEALAKDRAILEEFAEFVSEWHDRKNLIMPGRQRVAAGLSRGQAAKILKLDPVVLADYEKGRAPIPPEAAAAMAKAYGLEVATDGD